MKAIVQDRYGSTDVLALREVLPPVIGERDVLVRVRAAGVDQGVWHLMAGLPYLVRLMGYGVRAPKSGIRGTDFAGRVEAVGRGAGAIRPGDEVFGTCDGAFAEYALVRADRCAPKPSRLTFEQAAAVPTSACTALQGLRDHGRLRAGERVLVIGAGGGVGTFAVQIAKASGAHVTGMCSAAKADLVTSLGADRVLDRARDPLADDGPGYDVILDTAGQRPLSQLRRALAPKGRLVIVGAEVPGRWLGGVDRQLRALVLSPFLPHTLRSVLADERREDLLALTALIESGAVAPAVDRAYPLEEVPEAIRDLRAGRARGKLVITM